MLCPCESDSCPTEPCTGFSVTLEDLILSHPALQETNADDTVRTSANAAQLSPLVACPCANVTFAVELFLCF